MEPFHFDSSGNELFAMYHPASDPNVRRGIVLCQPFGNESARVYRACRLLAQRWSDKAHVLRFDYSGTGDSFGHWRRTGPTCWISDIARAAEELHEVSGASRMALAGIRFGALLAAHAAAQANASELIFWDPVLDGNQCRNDLNATHRKLVDSHLFLDAHEKREAQSELCGFPMAPWMDNEMLSTTAPGSLPDSIEAISVVQTVGQDKASKIPDTWVTAWRAIDYRSVDFQCDWNGNPEAVLNPSPVVEELAKCL